MPDDLDIILSRLVLAISEVSEAQAAYSKAAEGVMTPSYFCSDHIERCERAREAFKSDFVAAVHAAMKMER